MSPRKGSYRRIVDMSAAAAEPDKPWAPELPPVVTDRYTATINDRARYIQRLEWDEQDRLCEWAVIQSRLRNGRWQRVALYDTCHFKGVHLHLYDRQETEFTQVSLRPITSYKDLEDGLDYVLDNLIDHWRLENERRSDCGY